MKYRLLLTAEASRQLLETARCNAEQSGSIDVAVRWYDGFVECLESLRDNPQDCALARENDLFPDDLRELHYGSGNRPTHRAIFHVVGEDVEVVCIRHHAQQDLTLGDL